MRRETTLLAIFFLQCFFFSMCCILPNSLDVGEGNKDCFLSMDPIATGNCNCN